ncbi:MAG: flavodoxin [Anaerolineaceae bacterium]|nr:flavodoxin [Anaerolineaceae bacterium]
MAKVGLFFGSTTGHTEEAAALIRQALNQLEEGLVQTYNVVQDPIQCMDEFSCLILGTSTWDDGELQEDWRSLWFELDKVNLTGKKIAIYGLGNQADYPLNFQDAIASLAKKIRQRGAELVGRWPVTGYEFTQSAAVEDDHFYGLALDNDNQSNLTPDRVRTWAHQVALEFGVYNHNN